MKTYSRTTKNVCSSVNLAHNSTYYSVVKAKNSALNSKSVKQSSNGGKNYNIILGMNPKCADRLSCTMLELLTLYFSSHRYN